jgi:Glu-tRNA(Gln) amidotransferase subunit E-like FAD-binding protein
MEAKYGDMYSFINSPRALLFKNGFHVANDVETVSHLMRSNHVNNDNEATVETIDKNGEIESDEIVSNSRELQQMIISLKTVKNHVESKDSDSVSSVLTSQEQEAITAQVNEILEQLESSEESNENESKENLNLDSTSAEEISDKKVVHGSWHGLGARGDLRGWIGEDLYGLLPLGVIDTKVFNSK